MSLETLTKVFWTAFIGFNAICLVLAWQVEDLKRRVAKLEEDDDAD